MLRALALALLVLFAPTTPQESTPQQEPATPPETAAPLAPCGTCSGDAWVSVLCSHCEGDGKGPCVNCAVNLVAQANVRGLAVLALTDPVTGKRLNKTTEELRVQLKHLQQTTGFGRLRGTPGTIGCVGRCHNGAAFLNRGLPCKACKKKGKLKCPSCKGKGETACALCDGSKRRAVPCPECLGATKSPDPLSRTVDAESCPWCEDAKALACHVCDKNGDRENRCVPCAGSGRLPCTKCYGTEKRGCNKCASTGDLSSYFAKKNSNRCDKCNVKGVLPCDECEDGTETCKPCHGKGMVPRGCYTCGGKKFGLCDGCFFGSSRAWSVTAERLFTAQRLPEAVAHQEVAVARTSRRNEAELAAIEDDKARRKQRRQLDARLKKLRLRLAEMQKAAPK